MSNIHQVAGCIFIGQRVNCVEAIVCCKIVSAIAVFAGFNYCRGNTVEVCLIYPRDGSDGEDFVKRPEVYLAVVDFEWHSNKVSGHKLCKFLARPWAPEENPYRAFTSTTFNKVSKRHSVPGCLSSLSLKDKPFCVTT